MKEKSNLLITILTDLNSKKHNHMPERTCLVTGQKAEKSAFFRFVIRDGKLVFDNSKISSGRGGYVCKTVEALEKLSKLKSKICHFLKRKDFEIDASVIEAQKKMLL